MIWFYPLNELEISGYEAFATVLFSPILLTLPYMQNFLQKKYIFVFLRFCATLGILSFQASTTLNRLFLLCFGCFFQMLTFTIPLSNSNEVQRKRYEWSLLLGMISFVVSRIWFASFVPAWWDSLSNTVVFTVCIIADVCVAFQPDLLVFPNIKKDDDNKHLAATSKCWWKIGVGLGSLLYATQLICGEVSVITRWTVKGYPNTGPMPYPWGFLVLTFLVLGTYISKFSNVVCSRTWLFVGCSSFFGLYYLNTWLAFLAGLLLTSFISSLWPTMILNAIQTGKSHRVISLSVFVWLLEMLFSVWTVAYNFVPGGIYTRERTGTMICILSFCWIVSFFEISRDTTTIKKYLAKPHHQIINNKANILLLILSIVGLSGFAVRYPYQKADNVMKHNASFTAAIWTFHFGYDNKGWPSLVRAASLLEETGADVITLLESDASKPFLGNNDLGMWLGERLNMYVDFGPSTRDHTWGNLLLSKYPILKSVHHLLPSPEGELAPAITATVNISGSLVDFVVTHMGNDRDVLDRKLQAQFLAKELKAATNPVVFLGYVTSAPFGRDYEEFVARGNVEDIDSTDVDRWCEYIMYRGLRRLGYARLSHGGLSDTEIQMARFSIPTHGADWHDDNIITTNPNKVDQSVRFSSKFGSHSVGHNWLEVHKYHMNTPKYFL
ncbi:hypothetical protein HELRODRAFT_111285 [Helobdella robusta]|uniref:PGAP2-interacting protein n=1 Tax=Helobdella robusta TaxID=6412 RepID=T1EFA1_HELRO|nr:hypothetical protein HELRODRAFT_111285 [Helobdella robusta]ESO05364.1 hypothetical protein HELRODRAFT_111285 [Helobdella robusta]